MPLPRPLGLGVEKILVSSHEIPEDHVLHFVFFPCCCTQPCVRPFACCSWFFFSLGSPSPSLSLFALRAPLSFPAGCSAVSGEMSHFITIVTLHLGDITAPFPLDPMVPVPWGEGWLLVLLIPRRGFVTRRRLVLLDLSKGFK